MFHRLPVLSMNLIVVGWVNGTVACNGRRCQSASNSKTGTCKVPARCASLSIGTDRAFCTSSAWHVDCENRHEVWALRHKPKWSMSQARAEAMQLRLEWATRSWMVEWSRLGQTGGFLPATALSHWRHRCMDDLLRGGGGISLVRVASLIWSWYRGIPPCPGLYSRCSEMLLRRLHAW